MNITKNQLIKEIYYNLDVNTLVLILELITDKLDVNTISETARKNGISANGVKSSKRYKKLKIGNKLMAIKNAQKTDSEKHNRFTR